MGSNNLRINVWRTLRLAVILALALGYATQWTQMISNPVDRTGTDFIHFYAAGQIAQRYGYPPVYDLDLQQKIEEQVVGFDLAPGQVLPYNHVPYLIPLLKRLVNDNYVESFVRWAILLLIVYVAGSILFIRAVFSKPWDANQWSLLGGAVTFYPFFVSVLLGQDTALLLLGAAIWCIGILKKNDWLAGLGLALTTIRPHVCLALAIPLLFRDRKIWWRFFITALALAVFSILLLGLEGTRQFIDLLFLTAGGDWYGTHQSAMMNLLGLLLRILPFVDENFIRFIAWIGYAFGIGLAGMLWRRAGEFDERPLSLSIIVALFFVPHLHYHDLTLLILPLLLVVKRSIPKYQFSQLTVLVPGISFALFLSPALSPIYFALPYLLYFVLAWMLWHPANGGQSVPPTLDAS